MLNEFLFTTIEEEDIGNIWFQQDGSTCHTVEATLDAFCTLFLKIALSAAEQMSFGHLKPLDYYLLGAVKDKCYADKPDTIDTLPDNIREAIAEIQLHTIDNVLKNWNWTGLGLEAWFYV